MWLCMCARVPACPCVPCVYVCVCVCDKVGHRHSSMAPQQTVGGQGAWGQGVGHWGQPCLGTPGGVLGLAQEEVRATGSAMATVHKAVAYLHPPPRAGSRLQEGVQGSRPPGAASPGLGGLGALVASASSRPAAQSGCGPSPWAFSFLFHKGEGSAMPGAGGSTHGEAPSISGGAVASGVAKDLGAPAPCNSGLSVLPSSL